LESGVKWFCLWPKKEYRNEGIHQGDDKGNFKRIEILNEKKSHEQATDDGPDAFKNIDLSNGGGVFFDQLRIEFTPISKARSLWESDWKKDQKRGIKNRREAESFSGSGQKDIFEYPGEIDGKRKSNGNKKLEEHKDFYFSFYLFNSFADHQRTDRYQNEPVGEDDPKGELIPEKRNEKLPQQDDLCGNAAQPRNEKRGFQRSHFHIWCFGSFRLVFSYPDIPDGSKKEDCGQ